MSWSLFWQLCLLAFVVNALFEGTWGKIAKAIERRNERKREERKQALLEDFRKRMEQSSTDLADKMRESALEGDAEMHHNVKAWKSVFHAFGGADLTVYFNTKPVGEVQELDLKEDLKTGKVTGSFLVSLFQDSDLSADKYKGVTRIDVKFANEYGATAGYRIADVIVESREQVASVDTIVLTTRYHFTASSVHNNNEGLKNEGLGEL